MDMNCPNCGARLSIYSREPLRFVNREANAIDPPKFIIVESGAAGDWLAHSCNATGSEPGAPTDRPTRG